MPAVAVATCWVSDARAALPTTFTVAAQTDKSDPGMDPRVSKNSPCGGHALRTSILESILLKTRGSGPELAWSWGGEFLGNGIHVEGHGFRLCRKSQRPHTMSEGSVEQFPR